MAVTTQRQPDESEGLNADGQRTRTFVYKGEYETLKTTADALNTVKQYGRVVLVGMASDKSEIYTYSMIFKELTFVGSQGSTTDDLRDCLELLASGELDPKINICSFDEIGEGIDKLRNGEIDGRLVCIYD